MHLVRNFFVSVTNFNFKSVVKMQDTGHFTGENDRPRPEVVRLFWHKKSASILILASVFMNTEEFFAHLMEWARVCALID